MLIVVTSFPFCFNVFRIRRNEINTTSFCILFNRNILHQQKMIQIPTLFPLHIFPIQDRQLLLHLEEDLKLQYHRQVNGARHHRTQDAVHF